MTRRRRSRWRGLRIGAGLALAGILATALPTLLLRFLPPPTTAFMLQSEARGSPGGVRYAWVPIDAISPWLQLAVIAAEDQKFPSHRGFDFAAIRRAAGERAAGGRLRGASTLSQQVAKNLYLWPGKSFVRKGIEAWCTAWIELLWPKRRILEVYLNVAEFGPGIFGAAAASEAFFARRPDQLTREEAALLAAVLPNPRRLRAWNPGPYAEERTREILALMDRLGLGYLRRL